MVQKPRPTFISGSESRRDQSNTGGVVLGFDCGTLGRRETLPFLHLISTSRRQQETHGAVIEYRELQSASRKPKQNNVQDIVARNFRHRGRASFAIDPSISVYMVVLAMRIAKGRKMTDW